MQYKKNSMEYLKSRLIVTISLVVTVFISSCSSDDSSTPEPPKPPEPPVVSTDVQTIPLTFSTPSIGLDALTLDTKGNIYVSNFGQNIDGTFTGQEVFKITPEGVKTVFGSELNVPAGIITDQSDNIYVANGNDISKFTPEGVKSLFVTSSGFPFGGLTIDEKGVIYVSIFNTTTLRKIETDGTITAIANDPRLQGTSGIAYHQESATLYMGNFVDGKIYKVTLDGTVSELADAGQSIGRMIEMNGALYVTLFKEHKIAKITLEGVVEIIAGSGAESQKDGAFLEASFNKPNGIAGDEANNTLYVSDYGAPRISKIKL